MEKRGFTLIEALVVIAIIGVLMSFGIGYFMRDKAKVDAKGCMYNTYLLLKEAQLKAHTTKVPYEITFSGSSITITPRGGTGKTYDLSPCRFEDKTLYINFLGVFEVPEDTGKVEITNLNAPYGVEKKIIVGPFLVSLTE